MLARIIVLALAAFCFAAPATAAKKNNGWSQSSKSWKKNSYYKKSNKKYRRKYGKKYRLKYGKKFKNKYAKKKYYNKKFPPGAAKWNGGPKPHMSGASPGIVRFRGKYKVGSIVIDSKRRKLYYVLPGKRAYRYPIAVGKRGFGWTGVKRISRKAKWPSWRPPAEMRRRKPKLPKLMTGGLYNPLGARALYLGSSLYRIHGTYNTKSIGRAASSGCFRMHNQHVVHLSRIAKIGTTVYVRRSLPKYVASK
jgi:lipoprotein-anchoring transpeptidase ErfK/SrfK